MVISVRMIKFIFNCVLFLLLEGRIDFLRNLSSSTSHLKCLKNVNLHFFRRRFLYVKLALYSNYLGASNAFHFYCVLDLFICANIVLCFVRIYMLLIYNVEILFINYTMHLLQDE